MSTVKTRKIKEIAAEIKKEWKKPYFGAVPYINAMHSLEFLDDMYYADTAKSCILYFLSNATTWRGEVARRIKAELKALMESK